MGTVYRFKAQLTGFNGAPGVNTWHVCQIAEVGGAGASDLEDVANNIRAVYGAIDSWLATGVKMDISPVVEGFDIESGSLKEVIGITPPGTVSGSGTGVESRATQFTVRLKTDAIRGNRLLSGRHFLGPVGGPWGTSDGQVETAIRNSISAAYGGLIDLPGDARLVVWGRPAKADDTDPDSEAKPGVIGYVQSVSVNAVPGTLRSRKQ